MNRRSFLLSTLIAPFAAACADPSAPIYQDANEVFVSSHVGEDLPWRGSRKHPYATIDYAINQCKSEIPCAVTVMAGHSEFTVDVHNYPHDHKGWSSVVPYSK